MISRESLMRNVAQGAELVRTFDDTSLGGFVANIIDEKRSVIEMLGSIEKVGREEIERRLKDRNAKAFLHPAFETCEMKDVYSAYAYDLIALKAARELLISMGKEDEAHKVCVYVQPQGLVAGMTVGTLRKLLDGAPDSTLLIPRDNPNTLAYPSNDPSARPMRIDEVAIDGFYLPGNPRSISALISQYGAESDVGKLLSQGMRRDHQGTTLVIKRRVEPMENVTP